MFQHRCVMHMLMYPINPFQGGQYIEIHMFLLVFNIFIRTEWDF